VQELLVEQNQEIIRKILQARFDSVPPDVVVALKSVTDLPRLGELAVVAAPCPAVSAFQDALAAHTTA
jgi:hypothetical protein